MRMISARRCWTTGWSRVISMTGGLKMCKRISPGLLLSLYRNIQSARGKIISYSMWTRVARWKWASRNFRDSIEK